MIAPTWFLLIVTLFFITMGVMNIVSRLVPADTFKFLFKEIVFPILVILLIYIVLGAEI